MKKLILGSVVAAALVFTGCGDDNTTTPSTGDTTNPVVKQTATAAADSTVVLATDNVAVTEITLSGAGAQGFKVSGTTVTTPATAGNYIVHVVAKDAAGNSGEGDVNVTVTAASAGNGVTLNGLEWTALKPVDANATLSGRQTFAAARAICQDMGMDLPLDTKVAETNTTELKNIAAFNFDAAVASNTPTTALVIWTRDDAGASHGYALYAPGQANDDAPYTDAAWTADTTNFYTCVK